MIQTEVSCFVLLVLKDCSPFLGMQQRQEANHSLYPSVKWSQRGWVIVGLAQPQILGFWILSVFGLVANTDLQTLGRDWLQFRLRQGCGIWWWKESMNSGIALCLPAALPQPPPWQNSRLGRRIVQGKCSSPASAALQDPSMSHQATGHQSPADSPLCSQFLHLWQANSTQTSVWKSLCSVTFISFWNLVLKASFCLTLIEKHRFYFDLFFLVPMEMKVILILIWWEISCTWRFAMCFFQSTVCPGKLSLWTQTSLPHNFRALNTFIIFFKSNTFLLYATWWNIKSTCTQNKDSL